MNVCNAIIYKINMANLKIENFSTIEEFKKIQLFFKLGDINYSHRTRVRSYDESNPKILVEDSDIIDEKNKLYHTYEKELEFEKDFLFPAISKIYQNELIRFKDFCFEKGAFTEDLKEAISNARKNNILKEKELIEKADFLNDEVKTQLKVQIKKTISELNKYIKNPYPRLNRKLNINLKRNEIIALFYLLNKNGKIQNASKADIGRVLDDNFKYFDEKENKFFDIVDSRKDLANFDRGNGSKNPTESIKKTFSSEDFYNL